MSEYSLNLAFRGSTAALVISVAEAVVLSARIVMIISSGLSAAGLME